MQEIQGAIDVLVELGDRAAGNSNIIRDSTACYLARAVTSRSE
jgi:hypothetical protein